MIQKVQPIKCIPIESPFLRILARDFYQKHKAQLPDFSDCLLIFPTQRNKLYFRRYLLETSNATGIIPPVMKTIDELVEQIFEENGGKRALKLTMLERNFILKQVIDHLKVEFWQDLPFLRFISVGNRLLAFFDELAKELVSIEDIENESLSGHYPEKYVKNELEIIKRIYEEYRKEVISKGYCDEIDKYRLISGNCNLEFLQTYKSIIIAGLVASTAVENKLIKMLLNEYNAELIIHSSGEIKEKTVTLNSPFYLHYKMITKLFSEEDYEIKILTEEKIDPTVYHIRMAESESRQIFYLHKLLSRLKNRYKPHRIALILTDESIINAVIEALKSAGCTYNISIGQPFSQSILFSFLMALYDFIKSNLHYKKLFIVLKHPLFKNAVYDGVHLKPIIYEFLNEVIKKRQNYYYAERFSETKFKPLVGLINYCLELINAQLPLPHYIETLIEMLNNFLSYNQEFLKTTSSAVNDFFEKLHHLTKLRILPEQIKGGCNALEFILCLLQNETFSLIGDPMKGVQVIGLLEARNLDFDCVIIPSMNEGIFPRYSEKDLFINQSIRKQVGLPFDKERENLYYYYFTELTRGKQEVFLSYVQEKKRDIRSRYIDFLVEGGVKVDETKNLLENRAINFCERRVKKETIILKRLYEMITKKGLSPSSLKMYRECPYRFCLHYLIKIKEPDRIIEEPEPAIWGRALHQALRKFYIDKFPGGFTKKQFDRAEKVLYEEFKSALLNELAQTPHPVYTLDIELFKRRLRKFLEREIKRFADGYQIDSKKIERRVNYEIVVANRKITLYGFADRVDDYKNQYYIIDYKMRAPDKKFYQIDNKFKEFQLPFYAFILTEGDFSKIYTMAYYVLNKDVEIKEITTNGSVFEYLTSFKEQILFPTIKEILDPSKDFEQTTDADNCKYCSCQDLCGRTYV